MENILLVFGGRSYEHDISIVTASQIYNQTRLKDYKLVPLYISRENKFYIYLKEDFDLKDFSSKEELNNKKKFKEITFVVGESNKVFVRSFFGLKEFLISNCAILALHGGSGEDGRIASFFESIGVKCSAGNFDSLAVFMNKFFFKKIMSGLKIPVVSGFKVEKNEYEKNSNNVIMKARKLEFPVVIKANSGGSSIGVFVASDSKEFDQKINEAFEFDDVILVEKMIKNCREFNIAVLGNIGNYKISEIDEPLKNEEVLSFADKYLSGGKCSKMTKLPKGSMAGQRRKLPADIPESLRKRIKEIASKIAYNLRVCGVVRIDFLYDETKNKLYVCEVNAIPGSLAYYFFNDNSILLNDFVSELINIAKNKSEKFKEDFITNILN